MSGFVIPFLLIFPVLVAIAFLWVKNDSLRDKLVKVASFVIGLGTIMLLIESLGKNSVYFAFKSHFVDKLILYMELGLGALILYIGLRFKDFTVVFLSALQLLAVFYLEFFSGIHIEVANNLFFDKFSVIMALIIGIVGSLIAVFSLGYMADFHHHHKGLRDKRPFFFFVIFMFLSAMFGVVFSNNLLWLYFFWEITTLSSFFLIGYAENKESRDNALRALRINLFGGLGFILGIIYLAKVAHTIELDQVLLSGKGLVMLPAALIALAGFTKAAQLPFSSWLLGAMVAPTPVSALLHSSTMVKAGVYILLRFAPIYQNTGVGLAVALLGGVTFLITSFIAISQNNAKKVLAYSTIANLGLVVLCAGIGTYEAMWAGILLIIFHAIAKGLLFLCVGVVEHKIGSRNIEDMEGLIISMPKIAVMMLIGMAGMFLAPFGMLISKWAVLKALVDANPMLAIIVVFGSAATLFFWVKWMGKLIMVINPKVGLEENLQKTELNPLIVLSFFTVFMCLLFPLVSAIMIEPYVLQVYGKAVGMSKGNIIIMFIMLGLVMLFPLSFFNYGKRIICVDPYLCGVNSETHITFNNSLNQSQEISMKNYYLNDYFGEEKLLPAGLVITSIFIAIMFLTAVI